jgi:hypothetical protein
MALAGKSPSHLLANYCGYLLGRCQPETHGNTLAAEPGPLAVLPSNFTYTTPIRPGICPGSNTSNIFLNVVFSW